MEKLTRPKNQLQEVLYELIENAHRNSFLHEEDKKGVSKLDFVSKIYVMNPADKIMQLRRNYSLAIETQEITKENKHGRKTSYGRYLLRNINRAVEVYKSLTNG